ncbi:unnamed protein product [Paramecium octaurelia]|uniref:Uncharacterized protein n=1 Tax=Paramecium octaurelia TaxID=43137 RepID=A0A8S1SXZ0_PAROT|nr:unnamed protein product [Paramecium octaurelia]
MIEKPITQILREYQRIITISQITLKGNQQYKNQKNTIWFKCILEQQGKEQENTHMEEQSDSVTSLIKLSRSQKKKFNSRISFSF